MTKTNRPTEKYRVVTLAGREVEREFDNLQAAQNYTLGGQYEIQRAELCDDGSVLYWHRTAESHSPAHHRRKDTVKTTSMRNAHRAVIQVARTMPAVVAGFSRHGNPAIRKAAETMKYIAGMPDQDTARHWQSAEDALYYMPMAQIEECLVLAGYSEAVSA